MGSFVSFRPTDFAASGLLQEGDYLVQEVRAGFWDYDGKIAGNTIAVCFKLQPFVGGKADGDAVLQWYSAGDPTKFGPSDDGKRIVALSDRAQMSKSSNYFTFIENVVNAGFPEDKISDDLTVFEGMIAHFHSIAQQKRDNLPTSNLVAGQQQQSKEKTIPVVSSIIKLPWAKTAAKPAASAKPSAKAPTAQATAPAAASSNGSGPAELLTEHLAAALAKEGVPIARTKARIAAFKSMNGGGVAPADRDAAINLFQDDTLLENVLMTTGPGYMLDGANIVG